MKRYLLLCLVACLLFTSCGVMSLGKRIRKVGYEPIMDELVEHINDNDAVGIVNMFSEEVREQDDTLKDQAQALIGLLGHNVVSYESDGGSESSGSRPRKRTLSWHFVVETEDDTYVMSWKYVDENEENPEKIGFSEISIRTSEFNEQKSYGIDIDGIIIVTEDNYYDLKYKEAELNGEDYYPGKEEEEPKYHYEYIVSWGTIYYPDWEETDNGTKFLKFLEDASSSMIQLVGYNNGKNSVSDQLPFEFQGDYEEMDVHFGDIVIDEDSKVYIFYDDGHGTFAKVGQITNYSSDKGRLDGIERLKTEDDLMFSFEAMTVYEK